MRFSLRNGGWLLSLAFALLFATLLAPFVATRLSQALGAATALLLKPLETLHEAREYLLGLERLARSGTFALSLADVLAYAGPWLFKAILPLEALFLLFAALRRRGDRAAPRPGGWALAEPRIESFPCLAPAPRFGPFANCPSPSGPWALAQSPAFFAATRGLLLDPKGSPYRPEEIADLATGQPRADSPARGAPNFLDREKASAAFAAQLGERFDGDLGSLPLPAKALAAALLAQANGDREESARIFDNLNQSWEPVDFASGAAEIDMALERYRDFRHKDLERHRSHANVYLLALWKLARARGETPAARWLWLKPSSRALYYALAQDEGQGVWSEAAGVYAHYLSEEWEGRALREPQTLPAVECLDAALKSGGWLPQPCQDSLPNAGAASGDRAPFPLEARADAEIQESQDARATAGELSREDTEARVALASGEALGHPRGAGAAILGNLSADLEIPGESSRAQSLDYAIEDFSGDPLAASAGEGDGFWAAPPVTLAPSIAEESPVTLTSPLAEEPPAISRRVSRKKARREKLARQAPTLKRRKA
ncbi:MAG: hypothetical protein LBO66_09485 [Deltaproteobacteria bacterium]|jgi:hypothetical protein|nr:hypothetical protein [Deltaproteobacteria bacterium]